MAWKPCLLHLQQHNHLAWSKVASNFDKHMIKQSGIGNTESYVTRRIQAVKPVQNHFLEKANCPGSTSQLARTSHVFCPSYKNYIEKFSEEHISLKSLF